MKISESEVTVYLIELEEGDTVWDLYDELGGYESSFPVSIVNGAIEIQEPE